MYIVVSATTVYKIWFRITMDKVKWNFKNAKYERELAENKQWNGRRKFSLVSDYFKTLNALDISIKRDHSIQFSHAVVSNSLWPHGLQHKASLSITNSQSLLKLTSIESVMPSSHLILSRPLLLLPLILPRIRVSANESVLHIRWPGYWSLLAFHNFQFGTAWFPLMFA